MKHIFQTIIAAIVAAEGKAPAQIPLFAAGWIEVEGLGKVLVDRQSYDALAASMARRGIDIVIDYEHQTLSDAKAPAAGWIKGLSWDDAAGIVATVDWTAEAAGMIERKEYRYFSPVYAIRKSDRRLAGLHSVALTNAPRTNHLAPLLAAKLAADYLTTQEENMDFFAKLFELLGLAAGATEDATIAAVAKLKTEAGKTVEVVAKSVLDALGLEAGDTSTVVASIHALKQSQKGMVSRDEFEAIKAKLTKRDADDAVAGAMSAGKITPDQKPWAEEYAQRDPAGFATFVAKAPVVIPVGALPVKTVTADPVVDDAVLAVAKMFGNSAEEIKKYAQA